MKAIMKPIPPTATMPMVHIFRDNQSSLLEGFLAVFNSLEHEYRKDLMPMINPINSISI